MWFDPSFPFSRASFLLGWQFYWSISFVPSTYLVLFWLTWLFSKGKGPNFRRTPPFLWLRFLLKSWCWYTINSANWFIWYLITSSSYLTTRLSSLCSQSKKFVSFLWGCSSILCMYLRFWSIPSFSKPIMFSSEPSCFGNGLVVRLGWSGYLTTISLFSIKFWILCFKDQQSWVSCPGDPEWYAHRLAGSYIFRFGSIGGANSVIFFWECNSAKIFFKESPKWVNSRFQSFSNLFLLSLFWLNVGCGGGLFPCARIRGLLFALLDCPYKTKNTYSSFFFWFLLELFP